jgi:hypothetical protein
VREIELTSQTLKNAKPILSYIEFEPQYTATDKNGEYQPSIWSKPKAIVLKFELDSSIPQESRKDTLEILIRYISRKGEDNKVIYRNANFVYNYNKVQRILITEESNPYLKLKKGLYRVDFFVPIVQADESKKDRLIGSREFEMGSATIF